MNIEEILKKALEMEKNAIQVYSQMKEEVDAETSLALVMKAFF